MRHHQQGSKAARQQGNASTLVDADYGSPQSESWRGFGWVLILADDVIVFDVLANVGQRITKVFLKGE